MTLNVYLVRHGQTFLNLYNRLQGWCDSPLTPKGINDAHNAGQHLAHIAFNAAYHSDTTRAMRTCQYILEENVATPVLPNPQMLRNFREQSFGYFEGNDAGQTWLMVGASHGCRTYDELIDKFGAAATRDFLKQTDPFHHCENDQEYWQRIQAGFDYLYQHHTDGQNILLVSHSITIRTIVDRFAPEYQAPKNGPKNGAVTKLALKQGKIEVCYYNHYQETQNY